MRFPEMGIRNRIKKPGDGSPGLMVIHALLIMLVDAHRASVELHDKWPIITPGTTARQIKKGITLSTLHQPHFEKPQPLQKAQPSPNSSSPPQSGHSGQRPRWFLLPPWAQSDET